MNRITIDPVVSTNPEQTAYYTDHIQGWKAALKEHEKALKDLGNKTGAKAERKAIKDAILTCETAITGLAAKLPPTYVDPDLAKARIIEAVCHLDQLTGATEEFNKAFATNPTYAIEWRAEDVIKAQTVSRYVTGWLAQAEQVPFSLIPALIREFTAQVTRDLFRLWGDEWMTQAARADLLSQYGSGLAGVQFEADRLQEMVVKSAPVRAMAADAQRVTSRLVAALECTGTLEDGVDEPDASDLEGERMALDSQARGDIAGGAEERNDSLVCPACKRSYRDCSCNVA